MGNFIRRLEIRNRTERHSGQGSEVVIDYHIDPYKARPLLVSSLLGSVQLGATPADDNLTLPARDPVYQNYFCMEVETQPIDPEAFAGGISTGFFPAGPAPGGKAANATDFGRLQNALNAGGTNNANIVNADGILQVEYDKATQANAGVANVDTPPFDDVPTANLQFKRSIISSNQVGTAAPSTGGADYVPPESAGSFVRAIYRPVFSAYNDPNDRAPPWLSERYFDFVNPHFEPQSRLIRIDQQCRVGIESADGFDIGANSLGWPGGLNGWTIESWQTFTIQRLMCPRVPWATIAAAKNCINGADWAPSNCVLPNLPGADTQNPNGVFPKYTLRFDHAVVMERDLPLAWNSGNTPNLDGLGVNPVCVPNRCYDITYQFSWRTTWSEGFDDKLNQLEPHWLGWNMVFAGPFSSWKLLGLNPHPPAWYEVNFNNGSGFWRLVVGKFRKPYTTVEVAFNDGPDPALDNQNFDALFSAGSP